MANKAYLPALLLTSNMPPPLPGNPRPAVRWLYNGKPISESPHTTNGAKIRAYSLHLDMMRQYDDGQYTCVAENELGSVNHTFTVEANSKFAQSERWAFWDASLLFVEFVLRLDSDVSPHDIFIFFNKGSVPHL